LVFSLLGFFWLGVDMLGWGVHSGVSGWFRVVGGLVMFHWHIARQDRGVMGAHVFGEVLTVREVADRCAWRLCESVAARAAGSLYYVVGCERDVCEAGE
jgi:hypothetical protein